MAKREGADGLTPQQQAFVEALLTGKNIAQSARLAGCSRRAATYWMRDPDSPIRLEYEQRRATLATEFDARIARLHDLTLKAMEDLLGRKTPAHVRVQAVKLIYEAHLQEHGELKQPRETRDLVGREAEAYYEEGRQWGSVNVRMYDDKGQPRIGDDFDDS